MVSQGAGGVTAPPEYRDVLRVGWRAECALSHGSFPEVSLGLDTVESRAGEKRDEDAVDGGAVVAADERPVSTTEELTAGDRAA